jgi:hypothetical protein
VSAFGPAALLGLIFGFLWGIGCSLAIMYSIYLGGYRKAIKDSFAQPQPPRYLKALLKIQSEHPPVENLSSPSNEKSS